MLTQIVYFQVFGKPLIFYFGLTTLGFLFATALVGYLTHNEIKRFPIKVHMQLAYITLAIAFLHGLFGVLMYL